MTNIECPAEYRHIFCDRRMQRKLTGEYFLVSVIPSSRHPGYWDIERWAGAGYIDEFKRPISKDGGGYFLKNHFHIPADNWIAEKSSGRTAEEDAALWELQRARLYLKNVVYFLKAGPFIKIGFSSNHPLHRIESLKTGCPYAIELMGVMDGKVALERQLHKRFSNYRAHLEWFHAEPELISFIASNARPV